MRIATIGTILVLFVWVRALAQISQTKNPVPEAERNTCGGKHTPGDTLTCFVTFDGATDFAKVEVVFNRQEEGGGNFVLRGSRRLDAQTYKVIDILPQYLSGTYLLAAVTASRGKAFRSYQIGFGLRSDIVVEIEKVPVAEEPPSPAPPRQKGVSGYATTFTPKFTPCEPDLPDIKTIEFMAPAANSLAQVARSPLRTFAKNRCGGNHRPGESLTCYLRFADDTELGGLSILFDTYQLETAVPYYQRPKDQRGLCGGFLFDEYKKIDSRTYQVSGLLPACRSGRYLLSEVTAFRAGGADRYCPSREYTSEADVKKPVVLRLHNSHQTLFPEIIEVSATSPATATGASASRMK